LAVTSPIRWPRVGIVLGAVVTALGLALAATAPILGTAPYGGIRAQQTAGGTLVLVGWAILGWSIHRFGRVGR
jgi:hypothetical protein